MTNSLSESPLKTQEPRRWCDDGWIAQVLKNEDDDGWAVAMIKDGEPEPALVGPWTMGRDKKNPKPLDVNAFNTLVKTASEFVRRHEQQLHATLHQRITVMARSVRITVSLDIVPDEDNPYALLSATLKPKKAASHWHGCAWRPLSSSAAPAQWRGLKAVFKNRLRSNALSPT